MTTAIQRINLQCVANNYLRLKDAIDYKDYLSPCEPKPFNDFLGQAQEAIGATFVASRHIVQEKTLFHNALSAYYGQLFIERLPDQLYLVEHRAWNTMYAWIDTLGVYLQILYLKK